MIRQSDFSELVFQHEKAPRIITPRDYQLEAKQNAFKLWDDGYTGVLCRQPTGTGKTYVGSIIADEWLQRSQDHRVIVIAHQRQLVKQFSEEIYDYLGIPPAIEMAEAKVGRRIPQITVASRQTLRLDEFFRCPDCRKRHRKITDEVQVTATSEEPEVLCAKCGAKCEHQTTSRLHKFDHSYKWLVIADEAHYYKRSLASVRHIVDWFEQNPHSRWLGLTATPERGDGVTIADVFPAVAIDYRHFDPSGGPCAVRDGWVVPFDQRYIVVHSVDFKNLKEVAGDFSEAELGEVLQRREVLLSLIRPMLELVEERRTIIYSPTRAMAKNVALAINAETKRDCAKSLDGEDPDEQRQAVFKEHQTGAFQFLSVCGLCIAKNTPVLTDRGEVAIQDVTTEMRVWDGVEFVSHDGVISKGTKDVIEYAGLRATPDHEVWTAHGWVPLSRCQEKREPIAIGGFGICPVPEEAAYYRRGSCFRAKPEIAEVYDILNAGPRNRFTAAGLIVSNCKEGYNDPEIQAVAIFRPTKSRSLAEQMKGRGCRPLRGILDGIATPEERRATIAASAKPNCMIIDLVGVTGLADCATTAEIYAEGLPDEVAERASKLMLEASAAGQASDPVAAIAEAQRQLSEEEEAEKLRKEEEERERQRRLKELQDEKARLERERQEWAEKQKAFLAAKIQADVDYTVEVVKPGISSATPAKPDKGKAGARMPFGKYKGELVEEVPKRYLEILYDKHEIREGWLRKAIERRLAGESAPAQPKASKTVDDINNLFREARYR